VARGPYVGHSWYNFLRIACFQALLSYDRPEDLYQAVGVLYSVFHLDIDNLTLSLLNITLPNLLLQLLPANHSSAVGYGSGRVLAVSDGKFLNDPRGRALARLCVLCLNLMCTARQFPSTAGRFVDSSFCCRLHSVVDGQ